MKFTKTRLFIMALCAALPLLFSQLAQAVGKPTPHINNISYPVTSDHTFTPRTKVAMHTKKYGRVYYKSCTAVSEPDTDPLGR